ncbi:MAG: DUF1553 domain-containing protein [Acidobacteriia bacterium]|nr:DUF1553 domain-containing protein [Terriglobia bacterium]MYG04373.1 DUF1553 domain-containing protein [Terriglobia bacterium]MYK09164.1 DUF1553 domain-containing protein [Terriglobia bacterium]
MATAQRFTLTLAAILAVAPAISAATPEQEEFFEKQIRPILVEKCSVCHGEQLQTAGLDLTTAEGFYKGGESGPVFAKDAPHTSRLLVAVRYEGSVKMPPTGKLPDREIEALASWISQGAPWPGAEVETGVGDGDAGPQWSAKQTSHWAFQPIRPERPPRVQDDGWAQAPLDYFILAKLEEQGVAPAPRADRLTLLRRAKYDLHGLAPTEAEIQAFLADQAPGAFRRLVDRLLESPRYGEKWGRHWLDVARYADSTGLDDDIKVPYTWRYRDYVIDAFNRDTPFDQFIVEQLAGDLLPPEGAAKVNQKGVIATGFLAVGTKPLVQQDKIKMKYDVVDEQIDTMAKAFMGLTMGCARCHDHKFDPISAKDYYSMAAIFASVKNFESLDPAMTVSKVHLEPLVPQDTYRRYKDHQDAVGHTKRRIESIVDLEMYRHVIERRSPDLAQYMVAAYEVYNGGADVEAVADRERLDCEVLRLWVEYLEPGEDLRLYLREWDEAAETDRAAVAAQYQQRFRDRGLEWIERLDKWRQEVEAWDGVGEFPDKPNLAPGSDRFFSEVTLTASAMDEGADGGDGPFSVPERSLDSILPSDLRGRVQELRQELERLEESEPAKPAMAYAVTEVDGVDQHVFVRGNHNNPGAAVRQAFPAILAGEEQVAIAKGSGRLELARWLAEPDHPLTSRVIVNRIWQWHFGQGLVRTPNNFGVMGERPTHPALLDHLAQQFMKDGWSVKAMHRSIMLSSTYQMQSHISDGAWARDSGNRMWSRFNRRRLSVEEMRDSMLAIDGSLDLTMGGALTESLDSYGFEAAYVHPDDTRRRTVYLPIYRNKMPTLLTLFDFADPSASIAARPRTSVAPQGLYFMNSDFVQERARALASRLLQLEGIDDSARIEKAYWTTLTRTPESQEVSEMLDYIAEYPVRDNAADKRLERWQSLCRLLLGSNEFNYVN